MRFTPTTPEDRRAMLETIGAESVEALFDDIPESVRLRRPLEIPGGLAEADLLRHLRGLAEQNVDLDHVSTFLGAGAYDHLLPSVARHLLGRSEFVTSYTPYQPEVSQGVLQGLYEFQTMMCELFGMDATNASMYEGASAMGEAVVMAAAVTKRRKVVQLGTVHPEYREVARTYASNQDVLVEDVPHASGVTDLSAVEARMDDSVAALVVQQPNFFGCLEEVRQLGELAHAHGALFVVTVNPVSLGLLEAPGRYGADIVVAEGQPLGNAVSFGGPYVGIMAVTDRLVRRVPGRIAGMTTDLEGRRGYVLTLQTREQHIRRERATSNICTNQTLNAMAVAIYLAALGKTGIRRVAELCLQKAHYAREQILSVPGFEPASTAPFFHEFAVECPVDPYELNRGLLARGIVGGLPLKRLFSGPEYERAALFCVTEARTKEEIDRLTEALAELSGTGGSAAGGSAAETETETETAGGMNR